MKVIREWTRRGVCFVSTSDPDGPIPRGKVVPVRGRVEGAGAFGVWQVVNVDHVWSELVIVGDYLTAEQVLLDMTVWADQPDETEVSDR